MEGERIKSDQIKICTLFECQWNTFRSSVLRILIAVGKWVLGRVLGTGEREGERYGTGIVCWQQIVLGGLDRGGKGREKGNVTLRGLCVDSRLC